MKKTSRMIACLLGSAVIAGAEEEKSPPYYEGYDKQALLSGSALVALRDQNTQLLEALKASGWDGSIPLGRMPDGETLPYTPATYSAICGLEKSLAWLLAADGKCRLERDGHLDRPIDHAIEDLSAGLAAYPEEVRKHRTIIKLLERDGKPTESEAIEELARYAYRKFGSAARLKVHRVNGKAPGESWISFERYVSRLSALAKSVDPKEQASGGLPEKANATNLNIEWEPVDHETYRFVITEDSEHDWGSGGVKGDLRFRHGYWIAENVAFWDS